MTRVSFVCALLVAGAVSAEDAEPLTEDECQVLVVPANGQAEIRDVAGLSVLGTKAAKFEVPVFPDARAKTVVCWRSVARFVLRDRRVADAGLSLAVKARGATPGADRALILEKVNGGFRIRALQGGEFTPAEEVQVVELLKALNGIAPLPRIPQKQKL